MGRRALGVAIGLAPALAAGCGPSGATPHVWPPGTVLAVDDVAVAAAEVDAVAAWVALLYPLDAEISLRRKALGSFVLQRAAVRARHAGARAEALARARAWLAHERGEGPRPPAEPPPADQRSGTWSEVEPDVWAAARELRVGAWSDPVEGVGFFDLLRVDRIERGPRPIQDLVDVTIRRFHYVADEALVQAAVDASRLTIVDPAWDDAVPTHFKHRMRGQSP